MADYATAAELGTYVKGGTLGAVNLGNAALALTAASRAIDAFTGRDFTPGTTVSSTMTFEVRNRRKAYVRDFNSTTDLVIALDENDDGTAETTLTTSDYQLYPLNAYITGIGTAAYTEIRLVGLNFDTCTERPTLHVTARWGWLTVPDTIKRATLVLAGEMLKDPETPYGVAGFDQFGAVRVRANPRVAQMLQPFVRGELAVMVG